MPMSKLALRDGIDNSSVKRCIRHSFVVQLIAQGVGLFVMRWLGLLLEARCAKGRASEIKSFSDTHAASSFGMFSFVCFRGSPSTPDAIGRS